MGTLPQGTHRKRNCRHSLQRSYNLPPHPYWKIPATDFSSSFLKAMWENSFETWKEKASPTNTGEKYFSSFFSLQNKPWFHNLNLPRLLITWINRARAGHYSLNASLHKSKLASTPNCPCGTNHQDINHVVWQNRLRRKGW